MLKLLRYELQGRYKFILGGCIALVLVNLLLFFGINVFQIFRINNNSTLAFSAVAGFTAVVVFIVDGINLMRRDLFGDTGYLLLSLPQKGYKIVASKLIAAIIEFVLFCFLSTVFLLIHTFNSNIIKLSDISWGEFFNELFKHIPDLLLMLVSFLFSYGAFMIMVYFSLAAAKSILSNKKFGKLASFGIFVLLVIVQVWISKTMNSLFPNSVNYNDFVEMGLTTAILKSINYADLIAQLVILVGLFAGTSYLIEKRLDI